MSVGKHPRAGLQIAELMTQETPLNFAEAVYASLTDTSNWQAYAEVEDLLAQLK